MKREILSNFMFKCSKEASSSGLTDEEKAKTLIYRGYRWMSPCKLYHFSDSSVAFLRNARKEIDLDALSRQYFIHAALLNLDLYKDAWQSITDTWYKPPVYNWCKDIPPWRPWTSHALGPSKVPRVEPEEPRSEPRSLLSPFLHPILSGTPNKAKKAREVKMRSPHEESNHVASTFVSLCLWPALLRRLSRPPVHKRLSSRSSSLCHHHPLLATFVFGDHLLPIDHPLWPANTSGSDEATARSEAASCGGGEEISPLDPVEEEKLRNKSWLVAVGGKNPEG
ncbi:hypothetical protein Fmac_008448 [Flemingia macrophylla]|uniref:Uncharacterized protein n=1 Tax=Flemingia macrophylla TaxID=520843 RepID=A0ABD1MXH5_9FABA